MSPEGIRVNFDWLFEPISLDPAISVYDGGATGSNERFIHFQHC